MKKHEKADAIVDIIVVGMLLFTVMIVINDPLIRFLLAVLGCGAMYNNLKYVMKKSKKNNKKKVSKDKKVKVEEKK